MRRVAPCPAGSTILLFRSLCMNGQKGYAPTVTDGGAPGERDSALLLHSGPSREIELPHA